jgi:hypothetical protein
MSSNWNNEFFGTSPLGGNVHNNGSVSSENVLNFFKQHGLPNTWTSL